MLAELVENDALDNFFAQPSCGSAPTIKTLMRGKLKQKRQRRQKQLQRRHVYGFRYFPFPILSAKGICLFLGPLDPQTLGKKELLLDFYLTVLNF